MVSDPTHPSALPLPPRWADLRYLLSLCLILGTAWGVANNPQQLPMAAATIYLLVVGLDLLPPLQKALPPAPVGTAYFRTVLRVGAVLFLLLQGIALATAWQGDWQSALGVAVALGLLGGTVGASIAHELGHSPAGADRGLGWVLMGSMGYGHFMVEHYRGHHANAATWDDPGSAHEGESLWRFLYRAVRAGLRSAVAIEKHWLAQRKRSWRQSPMLWALGISGVAMLGVLSCFAWTVLLFWLVQCVIAIFMLESLNYVEHYGLYRSSLHGFHLPMEANHAWSTETWLGGSLLFNRGRHSDHHLNAWKPYPMAECLAGPRLPAGHAGSVLLALVPFVWYAFMHPKLVEMQRQANAYESEDGSLSGHL